MEKSNVVSLSGQRPWPTSDLRSSDAEAPSSLPGALHPPPRTGLLGLTGSPAATLTPRGGEFPSPFRAIDLTCRVTTLFDLTPVSQLAHVNSSLVCELLVFVAWHEDKYRGRRRPVGGNSGGPFGCRQAIRKVNSVVDVDPDSPVLAAREPRARGAFGCEFPVGKEVLRGLSTNPRIVGRSSRPSAHRRPVRLSGLAPR